MLKKIKNILLLTNEIPEYRIPVFNELGKIYNLTVAHFGKKCRETDTFFDEIILTKKEFGSFVFFKENIYKLASNYDVAVAIGDLHIIPYILLAFRYKRKFSLTFWGGDVSFSYNKHYDEDRKLDQVRFFLMNKADSLVFYCSYPVSRYVLDGGIKKEKLFVANNTVAIHNKIKIPLQKKYFLFVGTLYKAKKIYDLLEAYLITYKKDINIQPLIIVGTGDEIGNVMLWIEANKLNKNVFVKGAIYDQDILQSIFKDAICCISPGQAGLSVLTSMAYGVPFITSKNAFTGGEIFNIKHRINGIIYDGQIRSLSDIIQELSKNNDEVQRLSINAQNYYFENATLNHMVKGLIESIEYGYRRIN
jgi:glycosyltransferase involved in cell wall biosynthesis